MREKLNDNPVAQVALLGVLVLVVGFLLLTRMGGSEEPAAPAPTDDEPSGDPRRHRHGYARRHRRRSGHPGDPGHARHGHDAGTRRRGSDFKAGPGLPEPDVVKAYDANKVVVLLVVNNGSVDDDKIKAIAEDLGKRSDTELFIVEAGKIADYSRIAQGVDLQQTPALVVLRPKNLSEGAAQPTATIEYGFRGPDSVNQTVEDALYKGRERPPVLPELVKLRDRRR